MVTSIIFKNIKWNLRNSHQLDVQEIHFNCLPSEETLKHDVHVHIIILTYIHKKIGMD